jgi:hypothetical protein
MGTPCLDPDATPYEKLDEAIEFSEVNRARLSAVVAEAVEPMRHKLITQRRDNHMQPPTDYEVEVLAELSVQNTPRYKAALANERWGWRMATMYGAQTATVDAEATQQLLRELIAEVRGLRTDLRRHWEEDANRVE